MRNRSGVELRPIGFFPVVWASKVCVKCSNIGGILYSSTRTVGGGLRGYSEGGDDEAMDAERDGHERLVDFRRIRERTDRIPDVHW